MMITTIEQGENTVGTRTVTYVHVLSGVLSHRIGTAQGGKKADKGPAQ
ncbi:hypothetical protein ACFYUH_16420 [Streptomyces fimicarius]